MGEKQTKYRVVAVRQVRDGGSEIRGWTIATDGESGRFYETEAEAQAEAKRLTDQAEEKTNP